MEKDVGAVQAALAVAVSKGDKAGAEGKTREALDAGLAAQEIVQGALRPAMEEVGRRFEERDLFIGEMLIAANAMKAAMEILKPHFAGGTGGEQQGTVVIGSVEGDIHDIGKNMAAAMFEGAGYKVVDLGVSVNPQRFARVAVDCDARIVAVSALLSTTMVGMKGVVDALVESGVRDRVTIVVGGAPLTEAFAASIGADIYARDAYDGVRKVTAALAGEVK